MESFVEPVTLKIIYFIILTCELVLCEICVIDQMPGLTNLLQTQKKTFTVSIVTLWYTKVHNKNTFCFLV